MNEDISRSSTIQVMRNFKKDWFLSWQNEVIQKNKDKDEKLNRPWNSLPTLALLSIYCKSEFKDRSQSLPLVCKSWKYASDDPRCWTSMIPDSVSPEDAFINNTSDYEFVSNNFSEKLESKYYQHHKTKSIEEIEIEEEEVPVGLSRFRTLIKKSGGGAAITTLYLSPFIPFHNWRCFNGQRGEILHLIPDCCPNLKHISLEAPWLSHKTSTEALLQLFNRCEKLELVELSYNEYANVDDAPLLIQELGKCLSNLRGIRIKRRGLCYDQDTPIVVSIATHLSFLKLLRFESIELHSGKLPTTVSISMLKKKKKEKNSVILV